MGRWVMELGSVARAIIDESLYVVLGTADESGVPWVAPVYAVTEGYREFYWVSAPEVTHSRNIVGRPGVSLVVFDSRQVPGTGRAVYMAAVAGQVAEDELVRGLGVYNGPAAERGLREFGLDAVTGAAVYRLWRARVERYFMVCPRETGQPCVEHGRAFDHRTEITL